MPFEIPENWVWTILGNIGEIITGTTPPKDNKEYYGGNIPFYKPTDLDGGIMTNYALDTLTDVGYEQCRKLPSESVLVTCIGATIGKVGVIRVAGACNQQINAIIPSTIVDYRYLYYALTSDFLQREILEHSSSTTLPIINKGKFSELPFPLPSLGEQNRIVIEVEKWLDFIADIEAEKDELESHIKKTTSKILDLAISGKLVPQDPNDEPAIELLKRINPAFKPCDNSHYENLPFEIPSTWVWVSHNDMLEISGGAQPPKSEFSEIMKPGYIRLYQIRDYGEKPIPIYIPLSTASKTTVKGDILLARYGGSLGKVFIAEDGAYNVAMAKVILCYPEVLNQKFVYYYYLSSIYQNKLRSISRTAQAGFNSGDFEDMYFPLPPLEEQGRIVDAISSIWEMIDMITAEL